VRDMRTHIVISLVIIMQGIMAAQSVPAAIFTEPPVDVAHPASLTVLRIPSHGVEMNGIVYQPSGAGPHPTIVIFHGLPGNEKNLDLGVRDSALSTTCAAIPALKAGKCFRCSGPTSFLTGQASTVETTGVIRLLHCSIAMTLRRVHVPTPQRN
jgi:hypothetical protein